MEFSRCRDDSGSGRRPARGRLVAFPRVVFTDAAGRQWTVHEFSIYGGVTHRYPVGSGGAYRGFAPIDGGARRRYMMWTAEIRQPVTPELLAEQFAKSELDKRDDPDDCARRGVKPERVDPVR